MSTLGIHWDALLLIGCSKFKDPYLHSRKDITKLWFIEILEPFQLLRKFIKICLLPYIMQKEQYWNKTTITISLLILVISFIFAILTLNYYVFVYSIIIVFFYNLLNLLFLIYNLLNIQISGINHGREVEINGVKVKVTDEDYIRILEARNQPIEKKS